MIIVEGPDGSGKTTLIEQLGHERRAFKALRGGVGESERGNWGGADPAPVAYARQILQAERDEREGHAGAIGGQGLEYCDRRIAFDRFHLSEIVYGPILRGESGISQEEHRVLRRLLRAKAIPIIVCLPPYSDTIQNVRREGRERPSYQTLDFLLRSYHSWGEIDHKIFQDAGDRTDDVIHFDYTQCQDPATVIAKALRLPRPRLPEGTVGSPAARFLLVGERSNLDVDLPFFSMGNSSGFLNRSLWYAGFRESEMAFTNALTIDGKNRDLAAGRPASATHVIAFGVVAGTAARDLLDLPVSTLPHPEYWQRFHAGESDDYVEQLRSIRRTVLR